MARLIERIFDPAKPLVARRFFVAAGRHFNPGDAFDWRRMSVDQRRVRLLFDAGKLDHPAVVQATPTPVAPIAQEVQDDDIHHIAVTAAAADGQPASTEQVTVDLVANDLIVDRPSVGDGPASDGLDDLAMPELRAIAEAEGAPFKVSRADQREAIRAKRRAEA